MCREKKRIKDVDQVSDVGNLEICIKSRYCLYETCP